jgi:hypothetical protein
MSTLLKLAAPARKIMTRKLTDLLIRNENTSINPVPSWVFLHIPEKVYSAPRGT